MDREFNPIARCHVCSRWDLQAVKTILLSVVYLSGLSLVLEDTADVIHQVEGKALEEWRSDKLDPFENNDGCQPAEWMEGLPGSIKAPFPWLEGPQV